MKKARAVDYLVIGSGFVGQYTASALKNSGLSVELADFSGTPIRYNVIEENPTGTFSTAQVIKTKVLGGGTRVWGGACPRLFFPDGQHLILPRNGSQCCLCEILRRPLAFFV